MNLSFLETFLWLGTLKSVKETAKRMRVSQPVVSMRLAALQQSLGVELYRKSGRGIELTATGLRVLRKCETIVLLANDLQAEASRTAAPVPLVRVGVAEVIGLTWMTEFLRCHESASANFTMSVRSDSLTNLLDALRSNKIDVGFVVGPIEDPTMESEYLCRYPIKWLCAPSLVRENLPTDVVELVELPIIQSAQSSYRHQKIIDYFRGHNVSGVPDPKPNRWVDIGFAIPTCAYLARDGIGVSALPIAAVAEEIQAGRLVVLPIREEVPPWEIFAVYPKHVASQSLAHVLGFARDAVARYSDKTDLTHFSGPLG